MAALRRKQGQGCDLGHLEALVARDSAGAYEALQLFRSRALRFKTKGDPKAAITTAAHGARVLLKGSYLHAGSELSALAISIIEESSTELDADSRNIINEIDSAYESSEKDGSSSQQRMDFLKSCIKLTQTKGHRELGDPELHVRLGMFYLSSPCFFPPRTTLLTCQFHLTKHAHTHNRPLPLGRRGGQARD